MINWLANLSNRIALLCALSITLVACGGGTDSGEGFIPGNGGEPEPDPIPLSITTTALPNAIEGIQYTAVVEATGGEDPYTWTLVDDGGTGLAINNEGILSGTAPQGGDYGLTIQVTGASDQTAKTSFILTVTGDAPQPLSIVTTSLPTAEELKGYLAVLEATGGQGVYQWTLISSGGSGLDLRDDGLLSGEAPAEGQYGITVAVMDNTRTVTTTLILTVIADSTSLTITTTSLPTGAVKERYATVMDAAGGKAPYIWTLLSNGGSNLTLSAAGVLSGTPTLPGSFGLIFKVSDGTRTDQKALTLSITPLPGAEEPLSITTTALPTADRVLYAAAVVATGGISPYQWSGGDTGSPGTGFVIDSASGTITGNTNDLLPGQYGYSVTVRDTLGDSDTQGFVITVPGGDAPPVRILTENPLPTADAGLTYTTILRSVGGSAKNEWSIISTSGFGGPPPSFPDPSNGVLVWDAINVVEGNYQLTIQVKDTSSPFSSDVVTFDLQASAAPIRITTGNPLPNAIEDVDYTRVIESSGGGASNTWSASVTKDGVDYMGGPDFADASVATLTWAADDIEQGDYVVTIKVVSTDAGGATEDQKAFDLAALPPTP